MVVRLDRIEADALYTVKEAATLLEVSDQTVRRHLKNRLLRGVKNKNGRLRITGTSIQEFLQGGTN